MQKIRTLLLAGLAAALLLVPIVGGLDGDTVSAAANAKQQVCAGLGGSGGDDCAVGGQPGIDDTIANVVNLISVVAGIAAVIMIIIAGFRFITANGDAGSISAARRTVLYAVVGLVVVALSQAIVWFVLDEV